MKKLLLIPLFLILLGCDYFIKPDTTPVTIPPETHKEVDAPKAKIDASLLADCDILSTLSEPVTYESILLNIKENTIKYQDCKEKHHSLVLIIKDSLYIK